MQKDTPFNTKMKNSLVFGFSTGFQFMLMGALFKLISWEVDNATFKDKLDTFETGFEAMFCMTMALMQTVNAAALLGDINKAIVNVRKLFDIIDASEKKIQDNGEIYLQEIGDIEFEDVVFGYNEDRNVLNGINLKIEKNKFNAFCGYSGGGKSTILNLMLKLYEAKSGKITVSGMDINQIN